MKNIQFVDGAKNCMYDIFSIDDQDFKKIFPNETNICFMEDLYDDKNIDSELVDIILKKLWSCPVKKSEVNGISGMLFQNMDFKKIYYPTRKDEEAVNPDGSRLR